MVQSKAVAFCRGIGTKRSPHPFLSPVDRLRGELLSHRVRLCVTSWHTVSVATMSVPFLLLGYRTRSRYQELGDMEYRIRGVGQGVRVGSKEQEVGSRE